MKLKLGLAMSLLVCLTAVVGAGEKKHVLLFGGGPSHGPGEHEHTAGVELLSKCLLQGAGDLVDVQRRLNGQWPTADELAWADTLVVYCDGGDGHPLVQTDRLAELARHMQRGLGLVCIHYAVEYPKDNGGPQALDWLGGYFEANWSVNPHWKADYQKLPEHPVTQGVHPFSAQDEWYFHMRFRDDKEGALTHVLLDLPPAETMERGDGPHSGNPHVRAALAANQPQTTAWAYERAGVGRGFGFTGGHFHAGWANDDQRKLVLNAILWTAHADVPPYGVETTVTSADMEAHVKPNP